MPCLKIFTNLPKSKMPSDFMEAIIPVLAKTVKKTPEKFICLVSHDCALSINGDTAAAGAIASLESIGALGKEDNARIAKDITQFVHHSMGINPDRFFLTFYDLEAHNVAKGGNTIG